MQVNFDSDTKEVSLGVSAAVRVILRSGIVYDVCSSTISKCLILMYFRQSGSGMSQAVGTKVKLSRRQRKGQLPMASKRLSNTSMPAVRSAF